MFISSIDLHLKSFCWEFDELNTGSYPSKLFVLGCLE